MERAPTRLDLIRVTAKMGSLAMGKVVSILMNVSQEFPTATTTDRAKTSSDRMPAPVTLATLAMVTPVLISMNVI